MKRTKRRGSVLVLFVMLFLCLLGLAALVIDMGFARLAQCQMQSAVDSAALEGLRNGPATVSGRQQAGQMVAGVFNEDLDSSGGTVQYGAGPVVNFTGGIGPTELAAAQTMSPGSPPVYQPVTSGGAPGLELNLSNAIEGDMVAGTYGVNSSYPEPTSTADEDGNYNRRDFQPGSPTQLRAVRFWFACGALIIPPGSTGSRASVPVVRRCRSCLAEAA